MRPSGFLQGFASLYEEMAVRKLEVKGKLPEWLSGRLIRNGPGIYDLDKYRLRHWFDGMAMLHKFDFVDGQVYYSNRMLQSKAYQKAMQNGELAYREFASQPHSNLFTHLMTVLFPRFSDNVAINLTQVDGHYISLADSPVPVEFNPDTLDTVGVFKYDDDLGMGFLTTPHPHYDFANRTLFGYFTNFKNFGRVSFYNVYGIKDGSRRRILLATIQTDIPAYMHSFAMTENYIILTEFSFVLKNLLSLVFDKRPALDDYYWDQGRGMRFIVINKADGSVKKIWQGEAAFGFHQVNAYEQGDDIFVDLAGYKKPTLLHELLIDELLRYDAGATPLGVFRRYRLSPHSSDADYTTPFNKPEDVSGNGDIELPRINYQYYNTKPYRYAYFVGRRIEPHLEDAFYDKLVKFDLLKNETTDWVGNNSFADLNTVTNPQLYFGEPVFVPKPGAKEEDEGVVLSVVLDVDLGQSFLLVLDGQTFTECARMYVPHVIPFGFHGMFYS